MSAGINGPTGKCPYHGPYLYYCNPCHQLWRQAYPLTSEAISKMASGGGSSAAYRKAKKQDEANGAEALHRQLLAQRELLP